MQPGPRLLPERLWLVLAALWVVAITLTPFNLSYAPNELQTRIRAVFQIEPQSAFKDACHVVSFFVVGMLVVANLRRSRAPRLVAVATVVCGCVALESAQLLEPGRHARLTDLLLNAISAVVGLAIGINTSTGARLCEKLRLGTERPIAEAIVLTVAVVVWWVVCLRPVCGGLTMAWDRTYPLCLGNEIGGERQWSGQLRYAGIYGRALSRGQVGQLYSRVGQPDTSDWRSSHDLLVGYDFQTKPTTPLKPDGELKDDSLDLDVPADLSWSLTDGITISAPAMLQSRGSAMRLTDRITSRQAFSVEAWARPANLTPGGPARLISSSSSVADRNFTLGQWRSSLVFRARNRVNGPNATKYELWAPAVVATAWQHFVATYDHGVSIVYVDGTPRATIDLRNPRVYFGLAPNPLATAAMLILAALTMSLPATFVFRRVLNFRGACLAAVIFTLVAGITPYLINCYDLDAPRPLHFVGRFLVALLTYPLALVFIVRPADFRSAGQNFAHAA
jgi:VanZ family protein